MASTSIYSQTLAAAAVAILVSKIEVGSGIPYEASIILAIVILNALLGCVQEDRAERALASPAQVMPEQTTAIRDGMQQRILTQDLVPGDVLILREGDSVPGDARLAQAISLITTESSLTGGSLQGRNRIVGQVKRLLEAWAGSNKESGGRRLPPPVRRFPVPFGQAGKKF